MLRQAIVICYTYFRNIAYQALQLYALPVIRENRESLIGICGVSTKTAQVSDIIECFKFSH